MYWLFRDLCYFRFIRKVLLAPPASHTRWLKRLVCIDGATTKERLRKIRAKSGLTDDAGDLAQRAFSLGQTGMPFLAFNSLVTDTEKSEQSGLMNIFVGIFGAFRNVTTYGAKITWSVTEQDALDLLTLVSLLHRGLDAAVPTGRKP